MLHAVTIAESRPLTYGIAGSLAVHALLFLGLAIWLGLEPARMLMKAEPEPAVSLVFAESIIAEEPEPAPKPEQPKQFIRTSQNTSSEDAPKNASFISDRNTVASAKLAPAPDANSPLPSTRGVNAPTLDLANRDYKDGDPKNDSAPTPPAQPPQPSLMTSAQRKDTPPEKQTSVQKDDHLPLDVSKPGTVVDAAPMLKAPDEDEVLPKAIPVATPPAAPSLNTPRPERDAFQPETRVAEMRGSIGNRGAEDAVNAVMTAEGKYMAEIQRAVGIKWHKYVGPQRDMAKPGIFTVHFLVSEDGSVKPEDITVLSEKNNVVIESVAVKAIRDAKIPPVPRELRGSLDKGRFSAGINFLIGIN